MKPMLAKPAGAVRLSECLTDKQWWFQQKLDGDRLLICVDDGAVTALNRNGELRRNSVPRRLLQEFEGLPGTWRFDGELLDEFWVFDLPVATTIVSPGHSLEFRLGILETLFRQWEPDRRWVRLLPTARLERDKARLCDEIARREAEGVIMKHRSATYRGGCRTEQMLKFKLWHSADAVVTALSTDGRHNAEYAVFDDGRLTVIGTCSLEGKPPVAVGDVIELKYLYASADRKLYQPSLCRVRDDKPAEQCTIDQLRFTDRAVIEFTPKPLQPYVRQERRSRSTGTMVAIYDAEHPDSVFNPADGGRWATVCEDHSTICQHDTLARARYFAPFPENWCEDCRNKGRADESVRDAGA